ncbi:adenylate cyclase [Rhizobiaceae bacterium CRRU44]|uniref:Adenylate cyclase n=1 Tax=Ferranicluibacter rubi TaxID=2715133 RepID=A0AA43ZHI7_9HYPH|nr:FlgO family outer membrane protein [Ferranicluibacter rubi]NHT77759.1 adenylate cyclase [Ferranicluibacter rubi]
MRDSITIEGLGTVCPEAIRAQVAKIVASPEFPAAGRGAAFLTYIVEEVLAGRANRIKGYSIALEVFKRDEHFSQDDPVVRIEAGRLRRGLERYYLVAGQDDPVRIAVPKGGYIPVFQSVVQAEPEPSAGEEPLLSQPIKGVPAQARSRFHPAKMALGVIILLVAGAALVFHLTGVPIAKTPAASEPSLVIAPFANLGDGARAGLYATGITEELLTALPRFKEIRVFGRETSRALTSEVDVRQVREQLDARYLLTGGVRTSGEHMRISARLIDTRDGAILWSQTYDNDMKAGDLFTIQSDVASQVAAAIAQPYGIIAQADRTRAPPEDIDAYECTLSFYAYRTELSPGGHAGVRTCLEAAVERYPAFATAWAMLSMIYLDEERYRYNLLAGAQPPVERALEAARRATQLERANTRGQQALMTALFFSRDVAEAVRVGENALADNPNDAELLGEFGTRLAVMGQWQRGAVLLDKAFALNPGGGGFYRGSRALAAYMLGDTSGAVALIRQADLQKFPLFHGVAAIIYAEAGLGADARRESALFVTMRPDFVPNFSAEMRSRNMRPEDLGKLLAGLRRAGIDIPDQAAIAPAGQR